MKKEKEVTGFTLIELLVVIAIIAILAGVVIAFVSNSRAKATDALMKQEIQSMVSQSKVIYTQRERYENTSIKLPPGANLNARLTYEYGPAYFKMSGPTKCPTSLPPVFNPQKDDFSRYMSDYGSIFYEPNFLKLINDVIKKGGGPSWCHSSYGGKSWVFAVALKSDKSKAYCFSSKEDLIKVMSNTPGLGDYLNNGTDGGAGSLRNEFYRGGECNVY